VKRRALLLWAALPGLARAQVDVEANTASRAELESLPGLGPVLVQRLLAARPFKDWADLTARVPGIRAATAKKLSAAGLRVAGQAYSAAGSEPGGPALAQ
jgi:competence protein ComEA